MMEVSLRIRNNKKCVENYGGQKRPLIPDYRYRRPFFGLLHGNGFLHPSAEDNTDLVFAADLDPFNMFSDRFIIEISEWDFFVSVL